jgi:hypothetical protein
MTESDKPSEQPQVKLGDLKYLDGRRVNHMPENPGEYYGPVTGYSGSLPAVFFLKPNARDQGAPTRARAIQYVVSPPHTFTEESDGTLTIRASIGDHAGPDSESDGWHGYLTKGVWEKC